MGQRLLRRFVAHRCAGISKSWAGDIRTADSRVGRRPGPSCTGAPTARSGPGDANSGVRARALGCSEITSAERPVVLRLGHARRELPDVRTARRLRPFDAMARHAGQQLIELHLRRCALLTRGAPAWLRNLDRGLSCVVADFVADAEAHRRADEEESYRECDGCALP